MIRSTLPSFFRTCGLTLALALLAGCVQPPAEEAEHIHYDFKPVDFPAAVTQLTALQQRIESGPLDDGPQREPNAAPDREGEDSHQDHGDDHADDHADAPPLKRWHLVVRWLPEIAADSDLKRDAWERIAEPAQRLFDMTNSWEELPQEEQQKLFQRDGRKVAKILDELQNLAESEYPKPDELLAPYETQEP